MRPDYTIKDAEYVWLRTAPMICLDRWYTETVGYSPMEDAPEVYGDDGTLRTLCLDYCAMEVSDARVLAMLADADGAILHWQVPAISDDDSWEPAHAFEDALGRDVILFDADDDCYVHPHAKQHMQGGYFMGDDGDDAA